MKMMSRKRAFTLIELLVVIAVVGILAACLLPVLSHGQERARVTVCLNNLHQAGFGIAMYTEDFSDRFPPATVNELNGESKKVRLAIGGKDPEPGLDPVFPSAKVRPLHSYLKNAEVLHCPKDHGVNITLYEYGEARFNGIPTCWDTIGCSYVYNIGGPPSVYHMTKEPIDDENGLAGKRLAWVPEPSRYVLMYEPPAGTLGCLSEDKQTIKDFEYQFWHYSGFENANLQRHSLKHESRRFWAPILFVDGHVRFIDFTRIIRAQDVYICEPTADCIWYKPKPEPPQTN
jgi:prepilin-type N-terminal cleavage/methylation domain-containing protein/prepilin-type processing-associated H-X9-DG protein